MELPALRIRISFIQKIFRPLFGRAGVSGADRSRTTFPPPCQQAVFLLSCITQWNIARSNSTTESPNPLLFYFLPDHFTASVTLHTIFSQLFLLPTWLDLIVIFTGQQDGQSTARWTKARKRKIGQNLLA